MKQLVYMNGTAMMALMLRQLALQQQLIESQQECIALQKQLDQAKPKNPKDKEVFWHLASGMSSKDAANSREIETVRKFRDWNVEFAEKQVKPYVNPKVFSEVVNQMTRGLPERIAQLETKAEMQLWNVDQLSTTGDERRTTPALALVK